VERGAAIPARGRRNCGGHACLVFGGLQLRKSDLDEHLDHDPDEHLHLDDVDEHDGPFF